MCRTQGSSYEQKISKSDNYTWKGTQLTGHCHHQEVFPCHLKAFNSQSLATELWLECQIRHDPLANTIEWGLGNQVPTIAAILNNSLPPSPLDTVSAA